VWGVDNESAAESLLELSADPEAALAEEEANFRRLLDAELQRISAFYEKKVPRASDLMLQWGAIFLRRAALRHSPL